MTLRNRNDRSKACIQCMSEEKNAGGVICFDVFVIQSFHW